MELLAGSTGEGRIREILAFELVTATDEVGASGPQIEARIESVDVSVKIRSLGATKGLKPHSQGSTNGAAIGSQPDNLGVAEGLGWPLRKDERARENLLSVGCRDRSQRE